MTADKSYDKAIGYAHLATIDESKENHILDVNTSIIQMYHTINGDEKLLVAGAGNGIEALLLSRLLRMQTWAVDINIDTNIDVGETQTIFSRQDLGKLDFHDNEFDLIYCVHVLEHVDDERLVLSELRRVLKPTGVLYMGFPNKNRLVGYVGTNGNVSIAEKIKWNLNDYKFKLRGRYENKYGAHAGFTEKEYCALAKEYFTNIHKVRNEYMLKKYSKYSVIIRLLIATGLAEVAFPSNYFVCSK